MTLYANASEVALRLGRDVTAEEMELVPGLLEEATYLVSGHLQRTWDDEADVPDPVRVVCSRMTARALSGGSRLPAGLPDGTTGYSSAMGPMSHTTRLGGDGVQSSPWLSKQDRVTLAPFVRRAAIVHMPMYQVIE